MLRNLKPGKGNEIWLADAINILRHTKGLLCREVKGGTYHDCGNVTDYLKANVEMALNRPDINGPFAEFIKTVAAKL